MGRFLQISQPPGKRPPGPGSGCASSTGWRTNGQVRELPTMSTWPPGARTRFVRFHTKKIRLSQEKRRGSILVHARARTAGAGTVRERALG